MSNKALTTKNPNLVIDEFYTRWENISDLYTALYGNKVVRHYKEYMDIVIQRIGLPINAGVSERETYERVYAFIEENQKDFKGKIEDILAVANSQGEILDIGIGPTHELLVSLGAKMLAGNDFLAVLEA